MNRNFALVMIFVVFIGMLIQAFNIQPVKAASIAQISIVPSDITVGEESVPLPTSPFTVNITVDDVTDLFAWQVLVYYHPMILNFNDASYPTGHVFDGKQFTELPPAIATYQKTLRNETYVNFSNPVGIGWSRVAESSTVLPPPKGYQSYNTTAWLDEDESGTLTGGDIVFLEPKKYPSFIEYYRVRAIKQVWEAVVMIIEMGYLQFGATLIGGQPTFSGSGTLCQLNFSGISRGNSILSFSHSITCLLNSSLGDIPYEAFDGNVEVRGPERESSTITMDVSATSVEVGSTVSISGAITPAKANVDVLILYRPIDGTTGLLGIVKTDSEGHYAFLWTTTKSNIYLLKAIWHGDWQTIGAESPVVNVIVYYVFDIILGGVNYPVVILSNSTITNLVFNQSLVQIAFQVYGETGTTGYCNVTIPKDLLRGEPWTVKIDSKTWSFIHTDNATHSFLYFGYLHASTLQVVIQGTWVIPEFPSFLMLLLFMIATLLAVIVYRRKHTR